VKRHPQRIFDFLHNLQPTSEAAADPSLNYVTQPLQESLVLSPDTQSATTIGRATTKEQAIFLKERCNLNFQAKKRIWGLVQSDWATGFEEFC
jgi:hypothetical protein